VQAVDENLGKSPDLQTSEGYVYKRMGFCLNIAVDNTRAWKLWVPAELRPDLVWRAHHAIAAGTEERPKSVAPSPGATYKDSKTDIQDSGKSTEGEAANEPPHQKIGKKKPAPGNPGAGRHSTYINKIK